MWYLLLFLTSVVTLAVTLKRAPSPRFTAAFTSATLGLVFYIESVVVIVFNAYDYYPGLTEDAFQDTVYGNLFSQLSISATAALSLVLGLSRVWYLIFAAAYYLIELLFIRLGIYELHTYRSVYTLVGFAPLFLLIRFWHGKLAASSGKLLRSLTVMLGTNAVLSILFTMPLKVSGVMRYAAGIFEDSSKDHTTANLLYGLVITPLFILLFRLKLHWAYKIGLFGVLVLARFMLYKAGLIQVIPGWFFPLTLVEFAGRYGLIAVLDGWLMRKPATAAA